MVNLVIVSHSHMLAEGTREIALQMAGDHVRVEAVGGIRGEGGGWALGTDAAEIARAIASAADTRSSDAGDSAAGGVLLLVDVGSALMSTEQALELVPAELRLRCRISNAPLVEGAIVAALEAGLGKSLDEVNLAAEEAGRTRKLAM